MKSKKPITLTVFKVWEPLLIILNRLNHRIAKKNIQKYPQLACLTFEHIALTINLRGRYESATLELLEKYININIPNSKNKVALDIGANIGNHSVFLSDYFDEIYAFEPNPITFELLSINSRYSATKQNINVINRALGAQEGKLQFRIDKLNLGGSRIVDNHETKNNELIRHLTVNVQSGDSLEYLSKKDIALIKVDVEGHELQVFQGIRQMLAKQRPVILFEQEKKQIADGTSDVIDFLKDLEYDFLTIHKRFDGAIPANYKFIKLLLQTLFGFKYSLTKTEKFPSRFFDLIIAYPK